MVFSSGVVGGDELHAHGFCPLGEVVQDALEVTLLKVVLPPVGVLLAVGEHGVDQSGQLVGCGCHGPGFVHACTHAPVVRTQLREQATDAIERGGALFHKAPAGAVYQQLALCQQSAQSGHFRVGVFRPPKRGFAGFVRPVHGKDVLGEINSDGDNGHDFPFQVS